VSATTPPTAIELETKEQRRRALRRFIGMGTIAWTSFFVTDLIAARVHDVQVQYLLGLRLVGTGIGLTAFLLCGFEKLPRWALYIIEAITGPMAALLVSLAALRCGGATSPLVLGIVTIILARGVLPTSWRRALASTVPAALVFPVTVLGAARFDPTAAAQLDSSLAMWTLIQTSVFLALSALVAAGSCHLLWSAKEQVHEARRLGSYRLVARIGAGGMGEVWLARQMPLNRRVALKILKEATLRDPGSVRRFRREAEAASSLVHPNTIRVFDFGASDDGVLFIAMELLDGLDLEAIVARLGPLPPGRVVHVGRQVCGSLAEAHKRGIIHCDLKPANLFVTKVDDDYDFAKVLDFGLARVTGGNHATVDSLRGTPAFMPPEIIKGEEVVPESDIYSMGAVLYWMTTGTPVFRGSGFHETVMAHLDGVVERPSVRLGREVPADLEAVILKCLAKKKDDRYRSARELEEALAACTSTAAWTSQKAKESWQELRPSLRKMLNAN
jgi:hypothetical protein